MVSCYRYTLTFSICLVNRIYYLAYQPTHLGSSLPLGRLHGCVCGGGAVSATIATLPIARIAATKNTEMTMVPFLGSDVPSDLIVLFSG